MSDQYSFYNVRVCNSLRRWRFSESRESLFLRLFIPPARACRPECCQSVTVRCGKQTCGKGLKTVWCVVKTQQLGEIPWFMRRKLIPSLIKPMQKQTLSHPVTYLMMEKIKPICLMLAIFILSDRRWMINGCFVSQGFKSREDSGRHKRIWSGQILWQYW